MNAFGAASAAPPETTGPRATYSVVIPVYGNEDTLPSLLERLQGLAARLDAPMEAVFVVDGSPDDSHELLRTLLAGAEGFSAQLVALSRNFGSFRAVTVGLGIAEGDYLAVMAADLQEPVELVEAFFDRLCSGEFDIAVGRREGRADPSFDAKMAGLFWATYRRLVQPQIPQGGVDVFACTREVAQHLVHLQEANTSLVGLLYWLGYRRCEVPYERLPRPSGKSGWGFRRKLRYLLDSVYAFTSLPITLITVVGFVGIAGSMLTSFAVFVSWATGTISVAGYTPLMLAVLFMTSAVLLAIGVVGSYVWRAYENTKGRPGAIAMTRERFDRR